MPLAKNKKNDQFQRHDRRRQVAELYLRGLCQMEIARQLGCSQPTVSNDLVKLREEWLASALRDFNEAKAQELAKLDQLEREAWEAWERSRQDAESTHKRSEKAPGKARKGDGTTAQEQGRLETVRRIQEKNTRKQTGDPRFLTQVAWCIETRLKLIVNVRIDEIEARLAEMEESRSTRGKGGGLR